VGKSDDFLATVRKLDAKEAQNAIEGSGVAPVGALLSSGHSSGFVAVAVAPSNIVNCDRFFQMRSA
jgi:hypothetical protein